MIRPLTNLRTCYLWILIASLFSCTKLPPEEDTGTPPPRVIPVSSVEVKGSLVTINPGDTLRLTAIAKDVAGNILNDKTFEWASSDTSIASVDKGLVTGKAIGQVSIQAKSENITGKTDLVIGRIISTAYVNVPVSFGASVPDTAKRKVLAFYSALDAVKPGNNMKIPLIKDKESSIVFALDQNGDIMLFGLFAGAGNIELDAASTATAMVRFALNTTGTGKLTFQQLHQQINSAASFSQTVAAVQEQLAKGLSPFDTDKAARLATKVAEEVIDKNNGLINGRVQEEEKHYFIDGIFSGENLWFEDEQGAGVKLVNDTRLDWSVTSYNDQIQFGQKQLEWRPLEWYDFITILNPPKEAKLPVTNSPFNTGNFSIKVEQSNITRTKHCIHLMQLYAVTILESIGISGGNSTNTIECALQFAQAIVSNNEMPDLLTRPSGKAALDYMLETVKNIGTDWVLGKFKSCSSVAPDANKIFVSALSKAFSKIQLAISIGTSIDFTYQMVKYWDFSKTISYCKINGFLGSCERAIAKIGGDNQVCNPERTPNKTLDIVLMDKAAVTPIAYENVVFTRQGPDGKTEDFYAITNESGIAKCEGCYIGEKEGDYTFTCKSIIDASAKATFNVKGKYIFKITSTRHETTQLIVDRNTPNMYVTEGYAFYATLDSDSAYLKDNLLYCFYWGGDAYLSMGVYGSGGNLLINESKITDILVQPHLIQSTKPFKGGVSFGGYPFKTKDGAPKPGKSFEFVILCNGTRVSNTVKMP